MAEVIKHPFPLEMDIDERTITIILEIYKLCMAIIF